MGLKTSADIKKTTTPPPNPATITLELALYSLLTKGGNTYKKGVAYTFSQKEGLKLLRETDMDRQIWKMYKPAPKKVVKETAVVDMSSVEIKDTGESPHGDLQRLEAGTDEEAEALLAERGEDDDEGDVQV